MWEQFHGRDCTILCIELLLKHLGNSVNQITLVAVEVRILANKAMNMFNDAEIVSGGLMIIQRILGVPGRPEYWQILISQGIVVQINQFLKTYKLNNEIVTTGLKIILAFSMARTFTKTIAEAIDVECINEVFGIYFIEKGKIKTIAQIFSEIIVFSQEKQAGVISETLLKIIKRSFDNTEIIHCIFKGLSRVIKLRNVNSILVSDKAIELYQELMVHLNNDLIAFEDLLEFIYIVGSQYDKVREYIWKNEEICSILMDIRAKTQISSTGSSVYTAGIENVINILTKLTE